MECVAVDLIESPGGAATTLVLGRVLRFHVARRVWKGRTVDPVALAPVGRLGGSLYANLEAPYELRTPAAPGGLGTGG
jgi:flavin reductase (DIM6/NTAB) family NADH-FMN oxidoreductase RutF